MSNLATSVITELSGSRADCSTKSKNKTKQVKEDDFNFDCDSSWDVSKQNEETEPTSELDNVNSNTIETEVLNSTNVESSTVDIQPVTAPVNIQPVTAPVNIQSVTASVDSRPVNALEALVQTRINLIKIDNSETKIAEILEQGKTMLAEFKERGILVNGIDESMIIKEWSDVLYMDCNTNTEYLNNFIQSVIDYGFESPRPIQCVTSGRIAKGGDLIVQAKAGNGKTAAFAFGSTLRVDPNLHKTQVLILSPTQLLTDQTSEVVRNLTAKTGMTVHTYRGGLPQPRDGRTPQIVVACPGRMSDLIKRKKVNLSFLKTVILDEGDELLKQGFREQVKEIIETLADTVQICLFSATLPKGILELCTRFMRDPAYVILPENQVITELVTQWYVKCESLSEKDGCIVDIIEANKKDTTIVFFNSCSRLEKVSETLSTIGKPIQHLCLHAKMNPEDRKKSIDDFISGKCKLLLASDIAARGLDIPSITLVVNYDIPYAIETYVHRIGRSGRGDRLGNSITLIMSDEDKQKITFIVQIHGIPIKALKTVKMESKPSPTFI